MSTAMRDKAVFKATYPHGLLYYKLQMHELEWA